MFFSLIRRNPDFRTEKQMNTQCLSIRDWKKLKTIGFQLFSPPNLAKPLVFQCFCPKIIEKHYVFLRLECENNFLKNGFRLRTLKTIGFRCFRPRSFAKPLFFQWFCQKIIETHCAFYVWSAKTIVFSMVFAYEPNH